MGSAATAGGVAQVHSLFLHGVQGQAHVEALLQEGPRRHSQLLGQGAGVVVGQQLQKAHQAHFISQISGQVAHPEGKLTLSSCQGGRRGENMCEDGWFNQKFGWFTVCVNIRSSACSDGIQANTCQNQK